MSRWHIDWSGYKGMWLFVFFDLPVDSKEKRKEYTLFRKSLLKMGFSMLQFSVYARYFPSIDAAKAYFRRVKGGIPHEGEVRLLSVTDKQFGRMEVIQGKKHVPTEKAPDQMLLF